MRDLTEYIGRPTIAPGLSLEERVTFVTREIDNIKDLLEDYDDVKWIYEVLVEYTVALDELEERKSEPEELENLRCWLEKLKVLDPMRMGRWNDVELGFGGRRGSISKSNENIEVVT